MALFGEKYGDEVRVVSMGGRDPDADKEPSRSNSAAAPMSARTGDIGLFKIVGEGAVAAGVRRIEALTGEAARRLPRRAGAACSTRPLPALKATPSEVPARVAALVDERRKLERELAEPPPAARHGRRRRPGGWRRAEKSPASSSRPRVLDGMPRQGPEADGREVKKQVGSGVIALIAVRRRQGRAGGRRDRDLTGRFSAVDLVKPRAAALGGKGGGGRPDMAQAGGPDGANANDALAAIEQAMAVPA